METESLQLTIGRLNFEQRILSCEDGSVQKLTDLEIRVLRFLLNHAGSPVGRGELHGALWNPSASLRQVDDCIRRIRRKIERDPTTPEHLKSIWGVGYALLIPPKGPLAPPVHEPTSVESQTLRLGPHTVVNLTAHELVRQRQVVRLTANEVSLLTLLVEAQGRPVERTRLIRKIFGVVGERSLESLVRRLRVKIEDDPSNPRWLHTLRGRGLRLDWSKAPESNLPRALTGFVGRTTEMQEVKALLSTSSLVTITGPAGVGKSRLAVEAAAQWSGLVVYVSVTGAAGPDELVDAVAAALGIGVSQGRAEDVAVRLRQLQNPLLLIDGFEHLVEHAHILSAWNEARLLVASRSPLGLSAEARLAVSPLPADDAVALLRDRATSDPDDDDDLRAIVEQLDRMPLALELAAGWLPVLGTAELRRGLERGVNVPDDSARTLYTAVARSWDLLDDTARSGLLRLATGPWRRSMGEAEALLADGETHALSILRRLCDAGLVEASDSAEGMTYRVYDAVIRFCREQKGFSQEEANHAEVVSRLGGIRILSGLTGADAPRAYRTLVAAREPLAAAVRWGLDHDRFDVAIHALDALLVSSEFSGGGANAVALSNEVLSRVELSEAQRAHVSASRWVLLGLVSMVELRSHDVEMMRALDVDALDDPLRGWVLLRCTPREERRETLAEAALASFRRVGALAAMSQARRACATSLAQDGQVRASERQLRRAVALAREARAPVELGVGLIALSVARGGQGYADEAMAFAREAAAVLEPCGHRRAAALAWVNLGTLQLMCGQLDRAPASYQMAMSLYQDLSSPRHVALLHLNLGKTHLAAGRLTEAVQVGQVALRIAEDGNQGMVAAGALQLLAEADVRQEQPQRALGLLRRAVDYDDALIHVRALIFATAALAAAKADSSSEAAAAMQDAERLLAKVPPMYRLQCLTLLCEACVALRDWMMARAFLQRAEGVNATLTLPEGALPGRRVEHARALCGLGPAV